jgi:putative transposase
LRVDLLNRLDRTFTEHPVYGSRRLQVTLAREGISVGRRRIRRLMRKLGLTALRPKRNTSKPHPEHKDLSLPAARQEIDQPNQVWSADITYIPMHRGFLYLVAIIDWSTRRVLSWRLSNTLMAGFCVEALGEALAKFGRPGVSTPIRVHNLPVRRSRGRCWIIGSRSVWMDAVDATTTSLLSACGGR